MESLSDSHSPSFSSASSYTGTQSSGSSGLELLSMSRDSMSAMVEQIYGEEVFQAVLAGKDPAR